MQRPRDATRRNRNIGTSKQGHGQDNAMVIPMRHNERDLLDQIGKHQIVDVSIKFQNIRFIIEETIEGCVHACSIADISRIIDQLPSSDWVGLKTIILRQPTRKQLLLSPVWGRLRYFARPTTKTGKVLSSGPAIFIDAVQLCKPIVWHVSLDPEDAQELERLREDGHTIHRVGRKYVIEMTVESARRTQLYRTLLHEIGHWVDWLAKVEEPVARGECREELEDMYFARPKSEREAFAHRYAHEQRARLESFGLIPFDPCE